MRIKKMYQGTVPENKILDTYSDSATDTYSCNYVNNRTSWKLLGTISTVGQNYALNIPENAEELNIEVRYDNQDGVTFHIITANLISNNKGYDSGFYKTSSDMVRTLVYANSSKIWVQEFIRSGSSQTSIIATVYYK